jgi:adenine phosphoribosyltransferase
MDLKQYIRVVNNFPRDGISFKDITPLLASPEAFQYVVDSLATSI